MNRKSALFLLTLPAMLLIGCGSSQANAEDGFKRLLVDPTISIKKKAVTKSADIISFKDQDFYYFVFDLGEYKNVPVGKYRFISYDGHGGSSQTYEVSETTASAVERSLTETISHSTNWQNTFGVSGKFGFEKESDPLSTALIGKSKINVEIGLNFSTSWGVSDTKSTTNSYSEVEQFSKTEAVKTTINLSSNDPAGTYYYTMVVEFKAYGTIVKKLSVSSPDEPEYYAFVTPTITGEGVAFSYNVSPNEFKANGQIDFDLSIVEKYGLDNQIPESDITEILREAAEADNPDQVKYITIQDVAGLNEMRKNLGPEARYRLVNDIDMNGKQWSPFENFEGIFDGGGKKIYNFTIDNSDESTGFFKRIGETGLVKNLTIESAQLRGYRHDSKYRFAGMIVGSLIGGRIENCTVRNCDINTSNATKDNAEGTVSYCIAGMFAGKIDSWGNIVNSISEGNKCYAFAKYHDNAYCNYGDGELCRVYVGGFAGELFQGNLTNCSIPNAVSIHGKGEYRSNVVGDTNGWIDVGVGGLAGRARKGNYGTPESTGLPNEDSLKAEADPHNDMMWFGDKWEKVTTRKSVEIGLVTD